MAERTGHVQPLDPTRSSKGPIFWLIFLSLCLSLFLSALELTAVSTALPVIVNDLHGGEFAWIGTAYSLASTAFLPMTGGFAEIFGRRISMLAALIIFALGSALCGAAQSVNWLIAARTVQGLGGGGILSISSIIVSDLVPLRERGAYNGLIGLAWAVASAIGPLVGGALATHGQWRWLFYLNLPICGLSIAAVFVFLKLPTPPGTLKEKLGCMDWIGNAIFISSTTGVVLGLTWGGVRFSWSSPAVLVPLIVGMCGLCFFFFYEFRFATHPMIPYSLISNQTSLSGYLQTFLNPIVVLSVAYYLPVYYQACKDASALRSSVLMLGLSLVMGPVVVMAGISVKVLQVYRAQHWLAWCIYIAGMGGFTVASADSSLAFVVGMPILLGVGAGILYAVTYFPVLAPLPVSSNARALAFFALCRTFAGVWGVAIGASILQNELRRRLPSDFLRQLPSGSVDLAYAVITDIRALPEPLKDEVRTAFAGAVRVIWVTMTAILGLGLVASLFMRALPLQNTLDETWALEDDKRQVAVEELAAESEVSS